MRGPAVYHEEPEARDSLFRAIADLRGELDRLIDEQKAAIGGAQWAPDEAATAPERAPSGASEPAAPLAAQAPPDAAARPRRPNAPAVFDRLDDPSPTPPRPASTAVPETPPPSRPEDPRERLDALAKHLDRKLRQASAPNVDPPARPAE